MNPEVQIAADPVPSDIRILEPPKAYEIPQYDDSSLGWLSQVEKNSRLHQLSWDLKLQVQQYLDNPSIPKARKDAVLAKINALASNMRQRSGWDELSDWWMGTSKDTEAMNSLATQIGDAISQSITDDYAEDYVSAPSQVSRISSSGQNADLSGSVTAGESSGDNSQPLSSSFEGQAPNPNDVVSTLGSVVMACFGNVVGAISAVNSLNLADSQIGLMNSQSELASVQSSFVDTQIASTEASTSRTIHDLAYDIVHRTFDSHDFGQALEQYGSSLNDDNWSSLPYPDKVSKYLKHRAISQASNFPKSIQKPLITQINSMLNPNADDFKAWLSQTQASASEGNLRNEQNLTVLQEYGKGFGKLHMSMQRAQMEMNKEIFEYQKKLYKQYEQDGVITEESKTKIQELITRRKQQLVQAEIARLQHDKYKSLTDLSEWLELQSPWMKGLGQWLLPTVSDGMESMIYNFGSSFGSELGGALGNPWKNVVGPVGQTIGTLIK